MRDSPTTGAHESITVRGVPTAIVLWTTVPTVNTDSSSLANCFSTSHDPNEDGSVGKNHWQDIYDQGDAHFCTPAGLGRSVQGDQDKHQDMCPNWEVVMASLGSVAPTGCAGKVPETIHQLFLAQACFTD